MRSIRLILLALAAMPAMAVAGVASQTPADFSGRWVAVEPQTIAGHELVITQDAATLRLEQMRLRSGETYDEFGRRQGPEKGERESTSYRLDGQSSVTNLDGRSVRSSLRREKGRIGCAMCISLQALLSSAASRWTTAGGWCSSIGCLCLAATRRRPLRQFWTSGESCSSVAEGADGERWDDRDPQ